MTLVLGRDRTKLNHHFFLQQEVSQNEQCLLQDPTSSATVSYLRIFKKMHIYVLYM